MQFSFVPVFFILHLAVLFRLYVLIQFYVFCGFNRILSGFNQIHMPAVLPIAVAV